MMERYTLDDFNDVPELDELFPFNGASPRHLARRASPPWPEPLREDAFHGVAGEIVQAIEPNSESDPAALLLTQLVGFGNLVGRHRYIRVEGDLHYPNLYTAFVGATSKGRKSTAVGQGKRVLRPLDEHWAKTRTQTGLTSGEGLIWHVRDKKGEAEDAGEIEVDHRLLVVEAELAQVLKAIERSGNTLSPVLRDAWDTGDLQTMAKNSPARASGAHVSLIAQVTIEELRRLIKTTEMVNGFANRILWVCVKRSKMLPEGGGVVELGSLLHRLRQAVDFSSVPGELRRDDGARELWEEMYPIVSAEHAGLFGAVTSRAEAQALRLSMIYALLDASDVIKVEHVRAALAVWDYCERSAAHIFGETTGVPDADKILEALRRNPSGLTRTDIRDVFGRNKRQEEIDHALSVLEELNLAYCRTENTGGRPAERWCATTT
jgi:hypothetical protein